MKTLLTGMLLLLFTSCSTPTLDFLKQSGALTQLPLPSVERGYSHLTTRVITSDVEYKAFLKAIDLQAGWEHKVEFGIAIAKINIEFNRENLLIYRFRPGISSLPVTSHIVSTTETNATVLLTEGQKKAVVKTAQAFFYKVAKSIKKVTFKNNKRIVTVSNNKGHTSVPKECIAWFDGCNHCIRSATGQTLCTKRYCRKKAAFRCVKWQ